MLNSIKNMVLRLFLCTFTFHSKGAKFQSHRGLDLYTCNRCGNVFGISRTKFKKGK